MDRIETMKLLSILSSVWSGETIDDDKITAYQWALADVPYPLVEQAARVYLRRGKFFPKPAELLELIAEASVPEITSGEAWEVVRKQIGKHGFKGYERCDFGTQAIADAVRSVGWQRICLEDTSKGNFVRRDFDHAYEVAVKRLRRDVQDGAAALPGGGQLVALERKAS